MLDIDPRTANTVDDLTKMIEIIITNALMTPFESRVFNPKLGTNAVGMLQEPTNDVVNLAHTQSLVISALKRALPEIVVKIDVSYTSSGRGTSEVMIKMNIEYKGSFVTKDYSSYKRGFVN